MATQQLITFTSFLLLSSTLAFTVSAHQQVSKPDKRIQVVVEGVVYCQSCKVYGSWSFTEAKPITSAKVSITCKDHKDRESFYEAFPTNEDGYFYAQLDGFKMENYIFDHPLHSCNVRLVSSPDSDCNDPSNINYGLNGAALRYEDKRLFGSNYEAVVYSAGPFAFRPRNCY